MFLGSATLNPFGTMSNRAHTNFNRLYVGAKEYDMYLIKSCSLKDNSHTINFDLFNKDGEPILVESALEADGSRVVHGYDSKEDILERLWTLDLLCDGEVEVRGIIREIKESLLDHLYGGK